MKPASFEYRRPRSLEEALGLLDEYRPDAKVIAGGQSLVPMMNMRLVRPSILVDINGITELESIDTDKHGVLVGALARQRRVERSSEVRHANPLLSSALTWVGHPVTRNRGTVCGSLVHNDTSAELPAVTNVMGGEVQVASSSGPRWVSAPEFFTGPFSTCLQPHEMVTGVRIPRLGKRTGWCFLERARRHSDFALVGAVATVGVSRGGRLDEVRVVVFGVDSASARTPVHLQSRVKHFDGSVAADLADAVVSGVRSIDDVHASGAWRKDVARHLVAETLTTAVHRARG